MNQHRRIGLTDAASFLLAIYYLWYQLPFMRATFQAERYKYLFFACFAAGILLLCAARLENCRMRVRLTLRVSVLTPVLLYMAVMAVCYLLHAGDAARHIRVSFSFWGTLLVYRLFSFDRRAQVRFGRYLLFLFLLTALTSAAAVLTDSSAARAISNASQRPEAVARDYVLMRRNVSGIYLFQDLVIFAPISVLMLAGIREILIISTPHDLPGFRRLLGDGSDFGVRFEYAEQPSPDGLAQAFLIGEQFIGNDAACLVLGDNIFHGNSFTVMLREAVRMAEEEQKATVFGYWVSDPERYGVAEFDKDGNCLSIEEKPQHPKSNYAVTGLYFYPNKVVEVAKSIKPSARGELEITSVNQRFLADGELKVQTLGRGFAWLDTGTHDSLAEASTYIEVIEKRQGLKVACLEGIAYRKGWITAEKMRELAQPMLKNQYGQYLLKVIDELKHTDKPNLD